MIPFCKVKVASQDDPATVSQVRALWRNMEHHRRCWRSTIWSQAWDVVSHGQLADRYETPTLQLPPCRTFILFAIVGGSGAATVNCDVIGTTNPQTVTATGTRSGTYTLLTREVYRDNYAAISDMQSARLRLTSTSTGDLYYWGFFAGYETAIMPQQVPEIYEAADASHLRGVADLVNWYASQQQFLGGWSGSATGTSVGNDSYATVFRHYHLWDKSDDTLSLDKTYSIGLLTSATAKTTTARSLDHQHTHQESGASVTRIDLHEEHDYAAQQISGLLGESYSTTAGYRSVVSSEYARTAGDNTIYLNGWALHGQDTVPLSTTRSQSTSGAVVDADYYGIIPGQVIDTDTVTAIGRAQFNATFLKSGQYTSFIYPSGLSKALTSTHQDVLTWEILTQDLWLAPVDPQYRLRYTLTAVIEATGTRDMETRITSVGTSNTDLQGWATASGFNYVTVSGYLTVSSTSGHDQLILALRDKGGNQTFTIHSIVCQLRYDTTY